MTYNEIYSIRDVTDESGDFEEPVAIDEMKDYLRIEGYVDDDESTADDLSNFDFDDTLIADLIKASREQIERISASTIVPKTLEAVINNFRMIELPRGPIGDIVSLYDKDGVEITSSNYTIVGTDRKFLKSPTQCELTITYEAGYSDLPASLKIDIMRLAAYMYENRGDDSSIQKFAAQLAGKYKREGWIV
jgi:uncharacterized phiE125 gp8 family phage protein